MKTLLISAIALGSLLLGLTNVAPPSAASNGCSCVDCELLR